MMNKFLFVMLIGFFSLAVDRQLVSVFLSFRHPVLDTFFAFITRMEVLIAVLLIVSFLLYSKKEVVLILCASGMTAGFIQLMKFFIMRPRPFLAMSFAPLVTAANSSFPSSHAGFVFSALPFFNDKKYWLMFASLVAISRVYAGVHYFSDVIFGGVIGYGIGWIVRERCLRWFRH